MIVELLYVHSSPWEICVWGVDFSEKQKKKKKKLQIFFTSWHKSNQPGHLVKVDCWDFQSRNATTMFDNQETWEVKGGDMGQIVHTSYYSVT